MRARALIVGAASASIAIEISVDLREGGGEGWGRGGGKGEGMEWNGHHNSNNVAKILSDNQVMGYKVYFELSGEERVGVWA